MTDIWKSMDTAPRNASWILLKIPKRAGWPNYRVVVAHFAEGGGDEQPRFGPAWFWDGGGEYLEIGEEPIGWMHLPDGVYQSR